jgi:hypothetical protein
MVVSDEEVGLEIKKKKKLEIPSPLTKQGRFVALVPKGVWT